MTNTTTFSKQKYYIINNENLLIEENYTQVINKIKKSDFLV